MEAFVSQECLSSAFQYVRQSGGNIGLGKLQSQREILLITADTKEILS